MDIAGVLQFVQETGRQLVEPELLGLPACSGQGPRVLQGSHEELAEALMGGQEAIARQMIFNLYLPQTPLSVICDQVIAKAFRQIGEAWESGDLDEYKERLSCEIVSRILRELRQALPPSNGKLVAIGGSCEHDYYMLPTTMVELVLRQRGYDASSLGTNLPLHSLEAAMADSKPYLFWLSVSFVANLETFLLDYERLYAMASHHGIMLVVGGQGLRTEIRQQMQYAAYCDTHQNLESFLENGQSQVPPKQKE